MRNTVLLCVALIALVVGMFVFKTLRVPVLSEDALREKGVIVWPTPRELPPIDLLDHRGGSFTNAQLEGAWTFLFFGFTHCPDICPTSMSVLAQAKRQLDEQYPDLSKGFQGGLISVDPDRDTVEAMSQYVTAFHPDFLGATGEHSRIAEFATNVNVAFGKVPDGQGGYTVDHTGNIVIVNPMGHYHGFIKMPHDAETIQQAYISLQDGF